MRIGVSALALVCTCTLVSAARVNPAASAQPPQPGAVDFGNAAQSTIPAAAPIAAGAHEAISRGRPVSGGRSITLADAHPVAAIPEHRTVALTFPSEVRLGDFDTIKLTFEASSDTANTYSSGTASNSGAGGDEPIQNAYDVYNVVAEAELDLAGLQTLPYGRVSEPLAPGQPAVFAWRVRAGSTGIYRGTVWLFLNFIDVGSGAEIRLPISAQPVQISVTSLHGMPGATARLVGALGFAASIALAFPFALEALESIWRARRA